MTHFYRALALAVFFVWAFWCVATIGHTPPSRALDWQGAWLCIGIVGMCMLAGYLAGRESVVEEDDA